MKLRYLASLCLAPALLAQPVPKLSSVSAEYLLRGTSPEVRFSGENLSSATSFLVSGDRGLSAALAASEKTPARVESSASGISTLELRSEKSARAKLAIAPEAPLGPREVRIVTADGVSNPVTVNVVDLPEAASNRENRSLASAQPVEMPVTISGTIVNSAQSDFYKFKARKGEHVILEVIASRMGSQLDSSLAVLDKGGKELVRSEDVYGLDSFLDFEASEDGEFIAQLRDYRFQGGGEFRYRLKMGVLPHVASSFPFGGQRGQNVEVALTGQNLGSSTRLLLHLDDKTALGRQELRATTPAGVSNPFGFEVGDLPERMEQEPNTALDQADPLTVPGVANGRINSGKDYDAYRFRAEKGQKIIFDVAASRFGSSLDALLTLLDRSGNVLSRNDDAVGSDARLEYDFQNAGEYFLVIEDLLGRGGEEYGYRISARIPRPSFALNVLPDNPRIHRQGRVPIRCELARQTGFNDTVRIECEDLPPGLYAEPLLLTPSSPASGYLMITATKDAPLGPTPLKIVATGFIDGKLVRRNAQISTGDRPVKAGYLTVLNASPFELEPATLLAAVEQDETANIEAFVLRKGDFNGEVKITAEGFTAGREGIGKNLDVGMATLKPGQTKAALTLKPKLDSEVGARMIVLKGEASVGGQTITEYSSPIPVAASQVPFVLSTSLKKLSVTALPPGSGSAASEAVFTVKAERRAGFDGEITLALDGLPNGVQATIDKIPANGGEATIKLVATEKAPAGKDLAMTISGWGVFKDRKYKQQPGKVTLSISAPETNMPKTAEVKVSEAKNTGMQ